MLNWKTQNSLWGLYISLLALELPQAEQECVVWNMLARPSAIAAQSLIRRGRMDRGWMNSLSDSQKIPLRVWKWLKKTVNWEWSNIKNISGNVACWLLLFFLILKDVLYFPPRCFWFVGGCTANRPPFILTAIYANHHIISDFCSVGSNAQQAGKVMTCSQFSGCRLPHWILWILMKHVLLVKRRFNWERILHSWHGKQRGKQNILAAFSEFLKNNI